jgi:hypothetical protein
LVESFIGLWGRYPTTCRRLLAGARDEIGQREKIILGTIDAFLSKVS